MRITKVTTRVGDKGFTNLGSNETVSKANIVIQVLGDLDELSSSLGLIIVLTKDNIFRKKIKNVQNELFNLGGEISLGSESKDLLDKDSLIVLDKDIEAINKNLPPLKEFILPGENEISARLHFARAICRRSERSLVMMMQTNKHKQIWIKYLNRLSDYLFVLARKLVSDEGLHEDMWEKK